MQTTHSSEGDEKEYWRLLYEVKPLSPYSDNVGNSTIFNLLVVFYSIEASTLITLVLYTITHLSYNPMFLLEIWAILIVALVAVFYVLIIRRVMKLKVIISSRLTLRNNPELLVPPSDPGCVYKINSIRIPDELRDTLSSREASISCTIVSNEILAPSWELMKNHLTHIFTVMGYWSRQSDFSYIAGKCLGRVPVTLVNQKKTGGLTIADLLCFSDVTIENEIGEVKKSETDGGVTKSIIEPSRAVITMKNTELNLVFTISMSLEPTFHGRWLPLQVSSYAIVQLEFISYKASISPVLRAIIPSNLEKTISYLSRIASFTEILRNSVSSTDITLRKIYGLQIGDRLISDSVPSKKR